MLFNSNGMALLMASSKRGIMTSNHYFLLCASHPHALSKYPHSGSCVHAECWLVTMSSMHKPKQRHEPLPGCSDEQAAAVESMSIDERGSCGSGTHAHVGEHALIGM